MEDALLADAVPLEVLETQPDGRSALFHVSRTVLSSIDYFAVAASARWKDDAEPLRWLLPSRCTIEAAQLLLLRLYQPRHRSYDDYENQRWSLRYDWVSSSKLGIARVLELVLLADMLMLGPPVTDELRTLLRSAVLEPEHVAELRERCKHLQLPAWLSELTGFYNGENLKGGGIMTAISDTQIIDLMHTVCATGDANASKALALVLEARGQMGLDFAASIAKLLAQLLEERAHLQEEETVRGNKYMLRDGGRAILDAAVNFLSSYPEHVFPVARALFLPLPLPREQQLGPCATAQYREVLHSLLRIVGELELPAFFACIIEAGRFDLLEGADALPDVLARAGAATQIATCRLLAELPKATATATTCSWNWKSLRSVISAVVPKVCPDAQLELCDVLCTLPEDSLYQLVSESLLRGACVPAQVQLCKALAQLEVRRVQSAASAALLACLAPEARGVLCAPLLPLIHTLKTDVQKILIAELETSAAACGSRESQSQDSPHRIKDTWYRQFPPLKVTAIATSLILMGVLTARR